VPVIIIAGIPIVYSYILFKKLKKNVKEPFQKIN